MSCPSELALKLQSHPFSPPDPRERFEVLFVLDTLFGPTDTLEIDLALIPPVSATTLVVLDSPLTFVQVPFVNGLVQGEIPYSEGNWNDVRVVVRFATQDYLVMVNGQVAGPFPFIRTDFFLRQFRILGFADQPVTAWVDTLILTRVSQAGQRTVLLLKTFDDDSGSLPPADAELPVTCQLALLEELIASVQDLVDDGVLNPGQGNSLTVIIEQAARRLVEGNLNAACGQIRAFRLEVEGLVRGGILPEDEGEELTDMAEELEQQLGCA